MLLFLFNAYFKILNVPNQALILVSNTVENPAYHGTSDNLKSLSLPLIPQVLGCGAFHLLVHCSPLNTKIELQA